MTREQKLDFNLKAAMAFHKDVFPTLGLEIFTPEDLLNLSPCMMGTHPFTAHTGMFIVQLQALGSKE